MTGVDPLGLLSLVFDRKQRVLTVRTNIKGRRGMYRIPATSGRPGCGCDERSRNQGPIPAGRYRLFASDVSNPSFFGDISRRMRGDWGDWRVRLYPESNTETYGRSGFFLHGGDQPGSAGCIDIGGGVTGSAMTDRLLRDIMPDSNGVIRVRVR